jgi:hypothetical protein
MAKNVNMNEIENKKVRNIIEEIKNANNDINDFSNMKLKSDIVLYSKYISSILNEKEINKIIGLLDKSKEEEKNEEENIQELIPLSYRCLNSDHGEKYITLDRKKQNLICKNCYLSGALETNLELNQPFIDQYLKEEEQKKLNEESPQNVIKETSEESKNSESVEKLINQYQMKKIISPKKHTR